MQKASERRSIEKLFGQRKEIFDDKISTHNRLWEKSVVVGAISDHL